MAWAEKLPSGRYRGVYRDASGAKRSAGSFARKPDAVREASAKELTEQSRPTRTDPKITWGEFEPLWHANRVVEDSTRRTDEPKLKHHVRPAWKDWRIRDIAADDVQAWVISLSAKGLSASTVIKCYRLFSGSMRAAARAKIIAATPCKDIDLPNIEPSPERFLKDEEYEAIRMSMDERDKLALDLMINTGMRLGEALGLHKESIDLERKTLAIEWAWDREMRRMKPPKDYERRDIPIGRHLAELLSEVIARDGLGVPAPVPYVGNRRVRSGLLLAHIENRPLNGDNLRHRFEASTRIAWVGEGKGRRRVGHVRLHDLRHTYASRLLRKNVSIQQLSKLLGHASVKTTERYMHLADSQWADVRRALDDVS